MKIKNSLFFSFWVDKFVKIVNLSLNLPDTYLISATPSLTEGWGIPNKIFNFSINFSLLFSLFSSSLLFILYISEYFWIIFDTKLIPAAISSLSFNEGIFNLIKISIIFLSKSSLFSSLFNTKSKSILFSKSILHESLS